jgi:hypothetical protein
VELLYELFNNDLYFWKLCIYNQGRFNNYDIENNIYKYYSEKLSEIIIDDITITHNLNTVIDNPVRKAFIEKMTAWPGIINKKPDSYKGILFFSKNKDLEKAFIKKIQDETINLRKESKLKINKENELKKVYCLGEEYNISKADFWNDTKSIDRKISEWANAAKNKENPSRGGNVISKIVKTVESFSNFKDFFFL